VPPDPSAGPLTWALRALLALTLAQLVGGALAFALIHPGDYGRNLVGLLIAAAAVVEMVSVLLLMGVHALVSRRPRAWEREAARPDGDAVP
jgi:hypothetical protein